MEPDFSGWATKASVKCADGRTIMPNAFQHQDQQTVPLVWQHGHKDPTNVLGHVTLTNKEGSIWADAFFNDTPKAQHAKTTVDHKDIRFMSIWANNLIQRGSNVVHGQIREVSLVLSGANPEALIESITIRHADGEETLEDEAIIYTGLEFEHAATTTNDNDKILVHQDSGNNGGGSADGSATLQDVYDSMSPDQQQLLHFLVGEAVQEAGGSMGQDALGGDGTGEKDGKRVNVFDKEKQDKDKVHGTVLSHDDMKSILEDAKQPGQTLKTALKGYALSHGIDDIETLFPEATALTNAPEFITRRTEWVNVFMSGTKKQPFSRIKTHTADLTFEDARARGYIKGNVKKEQFFTTMRRVTTPKTVYKKQKLDRDDIIDITDFDVVAWIKGEMRGMLDEEIARAALVGDGRDIDDEDKINEENIRPIATDDDFYTIKITVDVAGSEIDWLEFIDSVTKSRQYYKGTGQPTFFTTETVIANLLLIRDTLNRRIFRSVEEIANELRVDKIVPVEILDDHPDIIGIMVNLQDYSFGADKGGQVALFDDFDIDYNQYKYLIETRLCGALTAYRSAIVYNLVMNGDDLVVPEAPDWDPETHAYTINDVTGVIYTDQDGNVLEASDGPQVVGDGEYVTITATADTGKYIENTAKSVFKFSWHDQS